MVIHRPRHEIEIPEEVEREAELRRKQNRFERELNRELARIPTPEGFENLPPAEQELFRLRTLAEQRGLREFGAPPTTEARNVALREHLAAQSRSIQVPDVQVPSFEQFLDQKGFRAAGGRGQIERARLKREYDELVRTETTRARVQGRFRNQTLQEQQVAAQSNPLTYVNIISTIADPLGYATADIGAAIGERLAGTSGEVVGGLIGGLAGPIPRNPIRSATSIARPSILTTIGADVLPGVGGQITAGTRRRMAESQRTRQLGDIASERLNRYGQNLAGLGDKLERAGIPLPIARAYAAESPEYIRARLDELSAMIDARSTSHRVVRPKWGTGISNEEFEYVARLSGQDPRRTDWITNVDPEIIRELRAGSYRYVIGKTVSAMRRERAGLRSVLKELEAAPVNERVKRPAVAELEKALGDARNAGDQEMIRHYAGQLARTLYGEEDAGGILTGGLVPLEDANRIRRLIIEAESKEQVAQRLANKPSDARIARREAKALRKEADDLLQSHVFYNPAEEAKLIARARQSDKPLPARTAAEARAADAAREIAEAEVSSGRSRTLADGGEPPPRKPGTPRGGDAGTPPPRDPAMALADDFDIPVHERVDKAFQRRFEGTVNEESVRLNQFTTDGDKLLKASGINPDRLTPEEMRPVFEVLHGERPLGELPHNLQEVVMYVRRMRDIEQNDMMVFLKNASAQDMKFMAMDVRTLASRMMAIPEYFPRLWKQTGERVIRRSTSATPSGRFGATPGSARTRTLKDRTFGQLIDAGFEPATWNPVRMMALRRLEGVRYRAQIVLANNLKRTGQMLPVNEAPVDGWRVPVGVGSVFEGRPIPVAPSPRGDIMFTPPMAVPNDTANFLENLFGQRAKGTVEIAGRFEVDVFKAIDQISFALKRIGLFGTGFQHIDMIGRGALVAFSPAAIRRGGPFKYPAFVAGVVRAQFGRNYRRTIRQRWLSNDRVVKNAPNSPTWRQLVQEGANVQGDTSILRREVNSMVKNAGITSGIPLAGRPLEKLRQITRAFEAGLFDGVYTEFMQFSARNFVVPDLVRRHPDWTSRQIAAEAAKIINEQASALGTWQTALKNPNLRRFTQWLIFSTNESEALIRQASGLLFGKNKSLWAQWYLGLFVGLGVIGNVINVWATGKPLPAESYTPLRINDPYAPFRVGYNSKFMSPQAPYLRGRNGQPVYIDLVGQMDTALRWSTDPIEALASRLNIMPRALLNQAKAETFLGQELDTPLQKAVQLGIDLGVPFGLTYGLEAVRQQFPDSQRFLPQQEGRIGTGGALVQMAGVNVRGEATPDLLERGAQQMFGTVYEDLDPYQKAEVRRNPGLEPELRARSEEGLTAADQGRSAYSRLNEIDAERIEEERDLLKRLTDSSLPREQRINIDEFRDRFHELQKEAGIRKDERGQDIEREPAEPDTPEAVALDSWYQAFETAETDVELLLMLRRLEQTWTPEQKEYVLRNTNYEEHAEGIEKYAPRWWIRQRRESERARERHRE